MALVDVFSKNRIELDGLAKHSKMWYFAQATMMRTVTPSKLMSGAASEDFVRNILPGNMYMYSYDPKNKETLPFYDKFPLVLPFRTVKGGFYGLNLHYLPYRERAILLDRLLELKNKKSFDETTKLRLSWQVLNGASKFALARPCVKHYLYAHVRSPFRKIEPQDWGTAILLPVQQFVGASQYKVWADTLGKM